MEHVGSTKNIYKLKNNFLKLMSMYKRVYKIEQKVIQKSLNK